MEAVEAIDSEAADSYDDLPLLAAGLQPTCCQFPLGRGIVRGLNSDGFRDGPPRHWSCSAIP